MACVTLSRTCDRARLSVSDRNYLTYEMAGQRFSARDAEEVVAVRMEGYDRPDTVILGTVTRYRSVSAAAPSPRAQVVRPVVVRERIVRTIIHTRKVVTLVRAPPRLVVLPRPRIHHASIKTQVIHAPRR